MFPTPFAEETQTQNGHRNMQIKENTCIHLFPISCMLSSLSIGQETWCGFVGFFNFLNFTFCFTLLPKASCEEMRVAEGELESQ